MSGRLAEGKKTHFLALIREFPNLPPLQTRSALFEAFCALSFPVRQRITHHAIRTIEKEGHKMLSLSSFFTTWTRNKRGPEESTKLATEKTQTRGKQQYKR